MSRRPTMLAIAALSILAAVSCVDADGVCANNVPLHQPLIEFPPCFDLQQQMTILNSTAMAPSVGLVTLKIPFNTFMDFFMQTELMPTWNPFLLQAPANPTLCQPFPTTVTNTPYMTNVPSTLKGFPPVIVAKSRNETAAVLGWSYLTIDSANPNGPPLIFGRHDYYIHDLGNDTISFGSWEKATGTLVYSNSNGWIAGLQEAMFDGMLGASCLEMVYGYYGRLDAQIVNASCSFLQYARPQLGSVPNPPGFYARLQERATAVLPCPSPNTPSPSGGGANTPAILAGIFGSLAGLLVGAVGMRYYIIAKHSSSSSSDPYVSMK